MAEAMEMSNRLNPRAEDKKKFRILNYENMKTKIIIERALPHSRQELLIKFDRIEEIKLIIKQLQDVNWSVAEICWIIPNKPVAFRIALRELRKVGYVNFGGVFRNATSSTEDDIKQQDVKNEKRKSYRFMQSKQQCTKSSNFGKINMV